MFGIFCVSRPNFILFGVHLQYLVYMYCSLSEMMAAFLRREHTSCCRYVLAKSHGIASPYQTPELCVSTDNQIILPCIKITLIFITVLVDCMGIKSQVTLKTDIRCFVNFIGFHSLALYCAACCIGLFCLASVP